MAWQVIHEDDFTGSTTGTLLQNHTPSISGSGYSKIGDKDAEIDATSPGYAGKPDFYSGFALTDAPRYVIIDSSNDDQRIEANIHNVAKPLTVLFLRWDANDNGYAAYMDFTNNDIEIYEYTNGTQTKILDGFLSGNFGDLCRFSVVGSTIEYEDLTAGTGPVSVTDSTHTSGTPGFAFDKSETQQYSTFKVEHDEVVGGGATVDVPKTVFSKTKYVPTIAGGAVINQPKQVYTMTKYLHTISTATLVELVKEVFNITNYIPSIQTGAVLTLPKKTFGVTNYTFSIITGTAVLLPKSMFTQTLYTPLIQLGAVIVDLPKTTFNITNFIPVIATGVIVDLVKEIFTLTLYTPASIGLTDVEIGLTKQVFNITHHVANISAFRELARDVKYLDLTPPFDNAEQIRWLYDNFDILQRVLKEGVTQEVTLTGGQKLTIRNGIIVRYEP